LSFLVPNTLPAERFFGCSFSEKFRDATAVGRNLGTLFGSPTVNNGVTLNGTSQYVKHWILHELRNGSLSFVLEFIPDFEHDDGINHYLYSSTNDDYLVLKRSNNGLLIKFGGIGITTISSGGYGPEWIKDGRNVLVICSQSGSTNAWLNGTQVLTGAATAWTPTDVDSLYIGTDSVQTAGRYFGGVFKSFKIFNTILSADDAVKYYDGTICDYRSQALVHLSMFSAQHDPTNVRTLDISGNGHNATFGDGFTPTTYPSKRTKRGYTYDSGDSLRNGSNLGSFTGTVAAYYTALVESTSGSYLWDARKSGGSGYCLSSGYNISVSDGTVYSNGRQSNITNQLQTTSVVVTGQSISAPGGIDIGARNDFDSNFNFVGDYLSFAVWDYNLTPIQVADWHILMQRRLNRV
jgi:hypothetical protein